MSGKMAKRVRRLEKRVTALEDHSGISWDASMEATIREIAETEAYRAFRRHCRHTEQAVTRWRRLTYTILIGSIICLILANMAVHADADDSKKCPFLEPSAVQAEVQCEIQEDFENERIEAALLDRSHVIENCTVTFYCNEKYPHICGTGYGIAYDGTPALAWATCAVDPSVIPLGSTVLVDLGDGEGLRTLVANDTGVKGNHIDICVGSHNFALQLGRQTATVYWCEDGAQT